MHPPLMQKFSLVLAMWVEAWLKLLRGKVDRLISNIFPILGGFFVNNVDCQSNHFRKTYNKAKCYEKRQRFNIS